MKTTAREEEEKVSAAARGAEGGEKPSRADDAIWKSKMRERMGELKSEVRKKTQRVNSLLKAIAELRREFEKVESEKNEWMAQVTENKKNGAGKVDDKERETLRLTLDSREKSMEKLTT